MVNLCIVKDCNNSSKLTKKKCKLFSIPKDELRHKYWLINCSRQDLLGKSLVYHRVCSDHFEDKMYANPDRTVLLPTAVPTDFSMIIKEHTCSTSCVNTSISDPLLFNNSVATSAPTKQKESISISSMIVKEHNYCTSCVDTSISDPLLLNNSVATSTPTKQKESISISCSVSPSSSYSADCLVSSSTQTTQILSLHTPRKKKYRAELQEMKNKYKKLEQKVNALSEEVAMKNSANAIDVNSVELFNRVVEAHLPPNLCMVLKHYVEMGKRKPMKLPIILTMEI